MKLIAHRGNIFGPIPNSGKENTQPHLQKALDRGFDVEVDLWVNEDWGEIRTGHDEPLHLLDESFMRGYRSRVWYHAKNFSALDFCLKEGFNVFWQHDDSYAVTSEGYMWHHSEVPWPNTRWTHLSKSIIMLTQHPDAYHSIPLNTTYAICTPFAANWGNRFTEEVSKYEEIHKGFVDSGIFWEYFWELSGEWKSDKYKFADLLNKRFNNDVSV